MKKAFGSAERQGISVSLGKRFCVLTRAGQEDISTADKFSWMDWRPREKYSCRGGGDELRHESCLG